MRKKSDKRRGGEIRSHKTARKSKKAPRSKANSKIGPLSG